MTKKNDQILRTHARQEEASVLSDWIMLICSAVHLSHWHNRSSKMSTSGGKWHRSCHIQQHNVSLKCFIWIVAWLCAATLSQADSFFLTAPSQAQTSDSSTSAPLNATFAPIPRDAISSSGKPAVLCYWCFYCPTMSYPKMEPSALSHQRDTLDHWEWLLSWFPS